MKTSQNILSFIETNGPCTVAEIAVALDRTKADIREQISTLCAQKRLERLPASINDSPGRPAARFALEKKMPDALAKGLISGLAQYLINNKLDNLGDNSVDAVIIDSLVSGFIPQGSSSALRLNQAIRYLEKIGVKAKWHATQSGPRIVIFQEELTPALLEPKLAKKVLTGLIEKVKEKAVGFSPTA